MEKPYTFVHVVPRSSSEGHTFAVVSVTTSNPDYSSADYTLRRLSAAVREGARQEGLPLADAYAYARDDLNIGDVASHGADEQLVALLGDVDAVSVEVYSSDAGIGGRSTLPCWRRRLTDMRLSAAFLPPLA